MKRLSSTSLLSVCLLVFCVLNVSHAQSLSKFQKWEMPGYFKGYNIGVYSNLEEREVTQQDFDDLRASGANLAVIQTEGTLQDSLPYVPLIYYSDPETTIVWQDVLDMMVNFARNTGIQYVISVRSGPGRRDVAEGPDLPLASTVWTNATAQQLYGQMLKDLAKRYLPDTLFVGMDLTQEPNPRGDLAGFPVQVLDSALIAEGIDVNALYSLWIDSVRTVAPDLPLMVQGVHWSNPVHYSLVQKQSDNKIVYKVHCYNPDEFSHADSIFSRSYPGVFFSVKTDEFRFFDKTFLKDTVYESVRTFQQTHNVPVMIGEFGLQFPQFGGEQYVSDIASIACELGWHFSIWNFLDGPGFNYQYFDQNHGTNYLGTISNFWDCSITTIEENRFSNRPAHGYELFQNYPNPFNPTTTVYYFLPAAEHVEIILYNILGRKVKVLFSGRQTAGLQRIELNGQDLSSGVYVYQLRSSGFLKNKKCVLLK